MICTFPWVQIQLVFQFQDNGVVQHHAQFQGLPCLCSKETSWSSLETEAENWFLLGLHVNLVMGILFPFFPVAFYVWEHPVHFDSLCKVGLSLPFRWKKFFWEVLNPPPLFKNKSSEMLYLEFMLFEFLKFKSCSPRSAFVCPATLTLQSLISESILQSFYPLCLTKWNCLAFGLTDLGAIWQGERSLSSLCLELFIFEVASLPNGMARGDT